MLKSIILNIYLTLIVIYIDMLFKCLFYVRPSDFSRLFKVRHVIGALIMTSIEHTGKSFWLSRESNPGPIDHKLFALTIQPRIEPDFNYIFVGFLGAMLNWFFKSSVQAGSNDNLLLQGS